MKLLIVDDEKIVLKILSSMMKEWDYEIILATDGEQAWELLQNIHEPVILLVDWIMSGMSGVELCRKIRVSDKADHTHLIMLTVKNDIEDMVIGFDAGADDFLSKPVDSRELHSRLAVGRRILKYKYDLAQRNSVLQDTNAIMENIMEQLRNANETLRVLSMVDELTGISNRRSLEEHLKREWGYALRKQEPLTAIMIDVDFFKFYNDTYGHQVGDDCLRKIATILQDATTRSGDLVARYGGEEFVITLRNTDRRGGEKFAASLCTRIKELKIPHATSECGAYVTVSLGIATIVPRTSQSHKHLIEMADKALYLAKKNGRDQWVAV